MTIKPTMPYGYDEVIMVSDVVIVKINSRMTVVRGGCWSERQVRQKAGRCRRSLMRSSLWLCSALRSA